MTCLHLQAGGTPVDRLALDQGLSDFLFDLLYSWMPTGHAAPASASGGVHLQRPVS